MRIESLIRRAQAVPMREVEALIKHVGAYAAEWQTAAYSQLIANRAAMPGLRPEINNDGEFQTWLQRITR